MTHVPYFLNGQLLFSSCSEGIATECCNDDNSTHPLWEENNGNDHVPPDLPCEPPTEWDGRWRIATLCHGGNCDNYQIENTLDMSSGRKCECAHAIPTEGVIGTISIKFTPPVTGGGTWTVWLGNDDRIITMEVAGIAGEESTYEMPVPAQYKSVILSVPGIVEFKSRVVIENRTYETVVYVWVYDWETYGPRNPAPVIIPDESDFMYYIGTDDGHLVYNITNLRSYATYDRAEEVLSAYENVLIEYIRNCACPVPCADEVENKGADWTNSPTAYEGILEGNNYGSPVIGAFCSGTLSFGVEMIGSGYAIYYQKKPYGGSWVNLAGGNAPGNYTWSGSANPCDEFRTWLVLEAGSGGQYNCCQEFIPSMYPPDDCTDQIRDAFDAIPRW